MEWLLSDGPRIVPRHASLPGLRINVEVAMSELSRESCQIAAPPRVVAISGVIFSVLFIATLVLVRLAVPADPMDPGKWLLDPALRNRIQIALNLVPFVGISFLWFMAVIRNRIGLLEDRFFATIFLGSGLLFVAMLFAAVAVSQGLLDNFGSGAGLPGESETYRVGRGIAYALMITFGMKMAGVFMFVTSMIGLRTGVLSYWVSFVGFGSGLIILLVITNFAWIALLFPSWVLLVSVWILIRPCDPA
jgi:hypothetical protein